MINRYEQPEYEGPAALLALIAANEVPRLREAIVASALYEEDFDFVQAACIRLAANDDEVVRGNAVLGFGHLARRFGELLPEGVSVVRAALSDPSEYVRGQAHAAADDISHFLEIDLGGAQ